MHHARVRIESMDTRHCTFHDAGTGADLPVSQFYDTTRLCCKACFRARRNARYDEQGASLVDRYCTARAAAKRRNISFELTQAEFNTIVSQPCFYSIQWDASVRSGVDRKDNSIGYNKDNCVPCCGKHNLMKNDIFTAEQAKEVARKYQVRCANSGAGRPKSPR